VNAGQPVFAYHFNHAMSFDGWGPNFPFCVGHVCHGVELPYLFQSVGVIGFHFTPDEQAMANSLTQAWGNFAWSGNPNLPVPLETPWPAYNPQADVIMEFMTPMDGSTTSFRTAQVSQRCGVVWQ
jgi:cholinesterase